MSICKARKSDLVDLPLGLLFLVLMAFIASPFLALVPTLFSVLAIWLGMRMRVRVDQLAKEGAAISNMKTGLLVEAVEGVETIKAGAGGWKFLARWLGVNGQRMQTGSTKTMPGRKPLSRLWSR